MTRERIQAGVSLEPGEMMHVDVAGVPICLVHAADGNFYAVRDVCSHEETPLSEGWTYDCQIECVLHNSVFDLRTGRALSLPATEPIATYPVTVIGGDVYVDV
jgi:3-phenylpropionate/trans-cinnamate dioxygenase ferredoxin component